MPAREIGSAGTDEHIWSEGCRLPLTQVGQQKTIIAAVPLDAGQPVFFGMRCIRDESNFRHARKAKAEAGLKPSALVVPAERPVVAGILYIPIARLGCRFVRGASLIPDGF
jgi:hypothetical protein